MIGSDCDESIEERLIPIPPAAKGFSDVLTTQEKIKRMLFWILDVSAPNIGKLTISHRVWIYDNIFRMEYKPSETTITKQISFTPPLLYKYKGDLDYTTEYAYEKINQHANKMENLFEPLRILTHENYENISPKMVSNLNKAIEYANKNIPKTWDYEKYEIQNLYQLLFLEVLLMAQTDTKIRKCKNCGLYFVVPNRKNLYCSRIAKGEKKPCNDIGMNRSFKKKMEDDPALKMYNRAYKTCNAKLNRIKSVPDWDKKKQANYYKWCEEAKVMYYKVKAHELELSEFGKWLIENKPFKK